MCSPVTCKTCQKTTWTGCGQHVEQVLANVPKTQQCNCPRTAKKGWLNTLLGR